MGFFLFIAPFRSPKVALCMGKCRMSLYKSRIQMEESCNKELLDKCERDSKIAPLCTMYDFPDSTDIFCIFEVEIVN